MNQTTQQALDQACAAVRADLAAENVTWHKAWFELSKGTDDSRSCIIRYIERPGGPVRTTDRYPKAGDSVPELPIDVPDADGRPWNQLQLTLYADGRHEVVFDYPGPRPDADRHYTEPEILANMAECVRHDLVFDEWTEAWVDAKEDRLLFLRYRNGPGQPDRTSHDCNGLDQWLARLWKLRAESGQGPWGRVKLLFRRGDDRVETVYQPPERKVVKPPPLPPRKKSLDELFRRIVAAERECLDDMTRRMDEEGAATGGWKRVRLTGLRDEDDNVVYVEELVEFRDGQTLDGVAEWEVEELFGDAFDRVDDGDDPTRLNVPGLKVEPGANPRFTLVLRNDPPATSDRRRK
jgi:hypothetical protein